MGFIKSGVKYLEGLKSGLEQMRDNEQAEIGKLMIGGIIAIVALVVIAILGSSLLPTAIQAINNTSTSGWTNQGAATMWGTLTIFVVLGFMLILLGIALYVLKSLDA